MFNIGQYISEHYLEIIAVLLSLAGVYLTAREKVICWIFGIAGSALYLYIFFKAALFADAALQILYIVIGFYGWYEWLYGGKNNEKLTVSKTPFKTYFYLGGVAIIASIVLIKVLFKVNDSLPYWDGITSVLSVIATWMMARKLIENWLLWIITDLIYIVPYMIKDLAPTALLYFIYILFSVYGYYTWKKQLTPSAMLQ